MRKSAITVIACIIIVITLVIFLPLKPGGVPPIIHDQPKLEDKAQLNVETTVNDKPNLTDSADSSNEAEVEYYVDEEGIKHYIIRAADTPDIEG